ncbi:hypothetical protein S7711_09796 [Stachybotrys chartarum IBT 7711]|uniref:lytic cellulose monooxygenase (C4-dehydrogenating) n=1 Tax=Stachybotrys chartarum (strain CBS 109288 / IBT 7711) TaxID=1280523 RepID=A0A084B9Y1_STACB|nr:hypothetical protein S7711_09796 [Stachybotrys chartarum IBT 7711]
MVQLAQLAAAALLAASPATAHYYLHKLIVNGEQVGGEYEYVRRNTNEYRPSYSYDILESNDLRCNEGTHPNMGTKTYEVKAGDRIGVGVTSYNRVGNYIWHPGPGFFYMSRANTTADDYDGSGDWFKVWESGPIGDPRQDENWGTWHQETMEFELPESIPDGEYLLRAEHFAVHTNPIYPQACSTDFMCAQIRIVSGGTGTPGPLVRIPGLYKESDPGFQWTRYKVDDEYVMPGPAVWRG